MVKNKPFKGIKNTKRYFMDSKIRKMLTNAGIMLAGFAVIGSFGAAAFEDGRTARKISHNTPVNIEAAAADTSNAYEAAKFIDFRKAGIDEYDMTVVSKAEKKKAAAEKTDKKSESFSMELPEDDTMFYDPQPEPLNYYETRSVADEFYTVYDIISGSTVTMNAHELLCRMVYSEIGAEWKEDAIKAQAVAAYSYLRFNDSLGLIPTVGLKPGYPSKIENCISAVEGQCVYYNGNIINAVYSASSAGYSAESENVWDVYYPYLRAVVSAYDDQDPNFGLKTEFTEEEVKSVFEEKTDLTLSDNVENWFRTDSRYSSRYIGGMTIDGHTSCSVGGSSVRITGTTVQKLFGLRSNAFTIDYKKGVFTFTTYGYGHGVGMSQWGACLYAENGYTYDRILMHYYVDTYLRVSDINEKAVERGKMSQEELDEEISNSEISGDNENDIPANSIISNEVQTSASTQTSASQTVSSGTDQAQTTKKTSAPQQDIPQKDSAVDPEDLQIADK